MRTRKPYLPFILALGLSVISGCASSATLYTWHDYDSKLNKYYENPSVPDNFIKDLKEVIAAGEETGKVPPGLYAELGYVLYEQGNYEESISYFQKESEKWIESREIMAKMIENAKKLMSRT